MDNYIILIYVNIRYMWATYLRLIPMTKMNVMYIS